MIANGKGDEDKKLKQRCIFPNIVDGEPEIYCKNFDNIKGLQDNYSNIFPRKEDVQEILVFLKEYNKILVVIGQKGLGRVYTVARAIRYAAEHDYEAVKDGAYFIDLADCNNIKDIY